MQLSADTVLALIIETLILVFFLLVIIAGLSSYRRLMRREQKYRHLFEYADVSIWDEDFSEVYTDLEALKKEGVTDFPAYLDKHPTLLCELLRKIKVRHANKASLELYGAESEEQLLSCLEDIFGDGAEDVFMQELCAIWDQKTCFRAEVNQLTLTGEELVVIISMPIPTKASGFSSIPVSLVDITERKKSESLVWQQANFDGLTQIANRNRLFDRIKQDIIQDQRVGSPFALLFIDLDGFKPINDNYGHSSGDVLLIELTRRLKECIRASDMLGRYGGDEFCIILSSTDNKNDIEKVVAHIDQAMSEPFIINKQSLQVSVSIGIALFPAHAQSFDSLFRNADQAMYKAKAIEGNSHIYYQ